MSEGITLCYGNCSVLQRSAFLQKLSRDCIFIGLQQKMRKMRVRKKTHVFKDTDFS